jgi:serine/threonine protein kinase
MIQQTQQLINNRYRIRETIGQGGFGTTYKAEDISHPQNKLCVIKQFTFQGNSKGTALELFRQEAEHLKALGTHDQIPTLIDSFDENGQTYLVQQYIDGQNLEQELAAEGIFSQQKIKELLDSLLPVLDFLHIGSNPIIHRDIKPANIIRRWSDGQFVLVDFGAVKVATETLLAKTGTSIGSAEYAAPEQLRLKATFASDIYSLGVTCIHLLTMVSPFDLQTSDGDWAWRNFLGDNQVDDDLGNILDKMIAQAGSQRYRSAAEVMSCLASCGKSNPPKDNTWGAAIVAAHDCKDLSKAESINSALKDLELAELNLQLYPDSREIQARVWRAEARLNSLKGETHSASIGAQYSQEVYDPELRHPKIFGDSAIMIWLSKNRRSVSGVGQIAIAATVSLGSAQIINAYLSAGVTSWWIPAIKIMFFNVVFVSWMSGMNELIEALPGSKGRLPLRLIAAAGGVAWITQGLLNAPYFVSETLKILF